MKHYILKEPKKNPQSSGYWAFVTLISAFMLYIMLIRPLTLPADKMPFIFEYDKKTHKVTNPGKQKRTYALLTGGAILTAGLFMIPVVINDNKHDRALALLWANREYIEHEEYMSMMDRLTYNVFRKGNADEIIKELHSTIDKHRGVHITGRKYFKKEAWDDLQAA